MIVKNVHARNKCLKRKKNNISDNLRKNSVNFLFDDTI